MNSDLFEYPDPDYSSFSLDELHFVRGKIDKEAYPDRFNRAIDEISIKEAAEESAAKAAYKSQLELLKKIDGSASCETYRFNTLPAIFV